MENVKDFPEDEVHALFGHCAQLGLLEHSFDGSKIADFDDELGVLLRVGHLLLRDQVKHWSLDSLHDALLDGIRRLDEGPHCVLISFILVSTSGLFCFDVFGQFKVDFGAFTRSTHVSIQVDLSLLRIEHLLIGFTQFELSLLD